MWFRTRSARIKRRKPSYFINKTIKAFLNLLPGNLIKTVVLRLLVCVRRFWWEIRNSRYRSEYILLACFIHSGIWRQAPPLAKGNYTQTVEKIWVNNFCRYSSIFGKKYTISTYLPHNNITASSSKGMNINYVVTIYKITGDFHWFLLELCCRSGAVATEEVED